MMKKIMLLLLCTVCISWNALAFDRDQIQIHGFASQGYLRSNHYDYLGAETEDGTVEFNEFGLNVVSPLTDRLRLGIQLLARDLGDEGNDEITVDWAFGDYRYRNWLGLRVGQIKRALGMYNQSRDIDAARTGVFLPFGVYYEGYRIAQKSVKGAELYGTLPGSVLGSFEYQIQYGTLDSGFETNYSSDETKVNAANNAHVFYLKWNTPLEGLKLVGTFDHFYWTTTTTSDEGDTSYKTTFTEWVAGVEYTRGNFMCAFEYNERENDMESFTFTAQDYYGLLSYRFTDWFELGTVYAVSYDNKDNKDGEGYELYGLPKAAAWRKDLALSARFDLNAYWIFKLEGHWLNGLSGASNYGDNPSEDGFLGAAKVTFSF
jgi:hypothetical protein